MEILLACLFYKSTMELVFFVFLQKIENIVFVSPINSLKHTNISSHFHQHLHDTKKRTKPWLTTQMIIHRRLISSNYQKTKSQSLRHISTMIILLFAGFLGSPNADLFVHYVQMPFGARALTAQSQTPGHSWCVFTHLKNNQNQSPVKYPQVSRRCRFVIALPTRYSYLVLASINEVVVFQKIVYLSRAGPR